MFDISVILGGVSLQILLLYKQHSSHCVVEHFTVSRSSSVVSEYDASVEFCTLSYQEQIKTSDHTMLILLGSRNV